ncbi:MAG TPA: Hsp20/alpha crystallin family protein [Gaiellaceae bacterium]|jgi:HSP20 family protein
MPRDIDRLQSEIEELFSDLWQVPRFMGHRRGFRPAVDVYRSQEPAELRVHVEVAGVEPESIQIVTSGRTLVVAGERSRPPASGTYEQMEIEYGPFQRTIQLPADVETEAATATYTHGVLTIVLPIATQPPSPRQVPIEVRDR